MVFVFILKHLVVHYETFLLQHAVSNNNSLYLYINYQGLSAYVCLRNKTPVNNCSSYWDNTEITQTQNKTSSQRVIYPVHKISGYLTTNDRQHRHY